MNDSTDIIITLKKVLKKIKESSKDFGIYIAANIKDSTTNISDYSTNSIITEYFTEDELEDIVLAFRSNGIYVDVSSEETEFISKMINGDLERLPKKYKAVYTSAQKGTGPGRKSLIPAFCNMLNVPIMGSNAYIRSLCRHKYHASSILKQHGLQEMKAWLYDPTTGWLLESKPAIGNKIIIKPVYESASIGVTEKSIMNFAKDSEDIIRQHSITFNQPIIIQEFVSGYEVEVPVIINSGIPYSLGVVGISVNKKRILDNQILTYDIVYNDQYNFYDFKDMVNDSIVAGVRKCAENSAQVLGMEGLGRIDFRVTMNGRFYITDISTNPHIVKHSSYGYLFNKLRFGYSDLPLSMLALLCIKNKWF